MIHSLLLRHVLLNSNNKTMFRYISAWTVNALISDEIINAPIEISAALIEIITFPASDDERDESGEDLPALSDERDESGDILFCCMDSDSSDL